LRLSSHWPGHGQGGTSLLLFCSERDYIPLLLPGTFSADTSLFYTWGGVWAPLIGLLPGRRVLDVLTARVSPKGGVPIFPPPHKFWPSLGLKPPLGSTLLGPMGFSGPADKQWGICLDGPFFKTSGGV